MNEIRSLRLLRHKNIIALNEVYEDESAIHLIFELMRGGELQTRIKQAKRLQEDEAGRVMRQLLETVEYCHKNGVVHRDIKPRNIILRYAAVTSSKENPPSLKLIDFGLSVNCAGDVRAGEIGGTPGYIAPEVLMRYSFNEKADIYSCGIVLYFMLAGSTPFSGVSVKEILQLNKRNNLRFDKCPWLSAESRKFIQQLTSTNPYARLSATKALASDWFSIVLTSPTTSKTKSIEESSSINKLDSYGFCNALVRTVSNNVITSKEQVEYLFDEEVKINKVPQIKVQYSISSLDEPFVESPQSGHRKSGIKNMKISKHSSGIFSKKHLVSGDTGSFTPNEGTNGMARLPKIKKISKFAVKAQLNPVA